MKAVGCCLASGADSNFCEFGWGVAGEGRRGGQSEERPRFTLGEVNMSLSWFRTKRRASICLGLFLPKTIQIPLYCVEWENSETKNGLITPNLKPKSMRNINLYV